ncbi:MAG: PTS sugar transporter subunit IIA [Planctomycetes bacterium]|nr:PTS sugar transporter subunit IIA [Planctomycetota bacterium]
MVLCTEDSMELTQLLAADRIISIKEPTKEAALKALVKVLGKTNTVGKEKELAKAISDRERILSTGIGYGIAIPHAKIASVKSFIAAIGTSKAGIPFESLDGKPVNIVVMIAGPEGQNEEYLRILARFTNVLKSEQTRTRIIEAKKPEQVMAILSESR